MNRVKQLETALELIHNVVKSNLPATTYPRLIGTEERLKAAIEDLKLYNLNE